MHGNEVRKKGKKEKKGGAWSTAKSNGCSDSQQPHNVYEIHLKGFSVGATFSLSTYMNGIKVNADVGNA